MELTPPRGTADLLPPRSDALERMERMAHRIAALYGYGYVETPAFERTELFKRTSGDSSDVVRKEMYTFEDRKGRSLTLRPEGTAPVVRAYLDNAHDLPSPFKAYYLEPMWRYGRPQAGRMREFRQFGVEVIGAADAEADVEVIALGDAFYRELGVSPFRLEVNSIGDGQCRPAYREELLAYLETNVERLTDEHRDRFRENPLRVLDCKDEACRAVSDGAPKIADRLCEPCKAHFAAVLEGLEGEGVRPAHVPTLVRGLDYYTRTTFEWVSEALPPGQATLGAGGRYDGLAELLGGPPTPGVGFALGLDRTQLVLGTTGPRAEAGATGVFVVAIGDTARGFARELARELRAHGIPAQSSFEERPLKAQLRMADRSGAAYAAIIGEREVEDRTVTVRLMADGSQEPVPIDEVSEWISRRP